MSDSEDLYDVMDQVHASQVKGKVYRLLFRLNENMNIRVHTPVGFTQVKETGLTVGLGTVDSAIISSTSIGNSVDVTFAHSDCEVTYSSLKLLPQSFMDNILRMAEGLTSAQYGNNLLEDLMGEKSLDFNTDKSCFLLMGNRGLKRNFSWK